MSKRPTDIGRVPTDKAQRRTLSVRDLSEQELADIACAEIPPAGRYSIKEMRAQLDAGKVKKEKNVRVPK